ncbi:MAG: hypothetical protein ABI162_01710 [Luteolibacter sp.]
MESSQSERCQCGYDPARAALYSANPPSGSTSNRVAKGCLIAIGIVIGIVILILAIVFATCGVSLRGINGV